MLGALEPPFRDERAIKPRVLRSSSRIGCHSSPGFRHPFTGGLTAYRSTWISRAAADGGIASPAQSRWENMPDLSSGWIVSGLRTALHGTPGPELPGSR